MTTDQNELKRKMEGAIAALQKEFTGLRTGRANASILENVQVEAYGGVVPLNQVGNVSVPEPRLLLVKVYDKSTIKAVEKAISTANLGLNASADGDVVRVPIPELSGERRQELVKIAKKYAEEAKIAVRNVRRDGMDSLKKAEKDGAISKDDHTRQGEQIQKLTDEFVKKIDDALAGKEKEILGG